MRGLMLVGFMMTLILHHITWILVTYRMQVISIRNKRQSIPKGKILCFVPNGFYLNPPEETFFCVNNIILPIFLCVCLLHDGHIWSVEIGRSSWWLNIIDAWMGWKHIKRKFRLSFRYIMILFHNLWYYWSMVRHRFISVCL